MSASTLFVEIVDVPTLLEDAVQSEVSTEGRLSACAPINTFYEADAMKVSIAHSPEYKFILGRYRLTDEAGEKLQLGGTHYIPDAVVLEVPEKAFLPYTVATGQPDMNHYPTIDDATADGLQVAAFPGSQFPSSDECICARRSAAGLITSAVPPVPDKIDGQRVFANGRTGFAEANRWCQVEQADPVLTDNGFTPFGEDLKHWDRSTSCVHHALKGTLDWVLVYTYVANDWDGEASAAYGAAYKKQPSDPVLAMPSFEVFGRSEDYVCDCEHVAVCAVKEHLVVKAHSDQYAAFLRVKNESPRDYILENAAIHVVKVLVQAGFTVLDPVVRLQVTFTAEQGDVPILPMIGLLHGDLDINLNGDNSRVLPTVPHDTVGLGCTACLYWGRSRFDDRIQ